MSSPAKLRVAVIYGGRSGEHEISLRSAASVIQHLDTSQFEIVPVGIDQGGGWHALPPEILSKIEGGSLPRIDTAGGVPTALPVAKAIQNGSGKGLGAVDVVFPVMHGPLCEDGSIQGLLELADLPYVGSGVLGSAVAMDKDVAKRLLDDAGLPVVPGICARAWRWKSEPKTVLGKIGTELGYPVFVKPANLGSSVGVHRVQSEDGIEAALDDAFRYDTKVLIEKALNVREIEFAVLESESESEGPKVSVPGEIVPTHTFYSYEAKYLDDNGARLDIPAKLSEEDREKMSKTALRAFEVLECEGMARVDLFKDKDSGAIYVNELNTIPGFTTISMYPKLWEATGVPYGELLTRLIRLAMRRHDRRASLKRTWKG